MEIETIKNLRLFPLRHRRGTAAIDRRMVLFGSYGSNDVSVNDGILHFVQHLLKTFHARDWAKVEHVINSKPESF